MSRTAAGIMIFLSGVFAGMMALEYTKPHYHGGPTVQQIMEMCR